MPIDRECTSSSCTIYNKHTDIPIGDSTTAGVSMLEDPMTDKKHRRGAMKKRTSAHESDSILFHKII